MLDRSIFNTEHARRWLTAQVFCRWAAASRLAAGVTIFCGDVFQHRVAEHGLGQLGGDLRLEPAGEANPNLRHLRVFAAAVRLGAMTRAAQEQGLSQPAASQAVHKLERRYNSELLLRGGSGTAPTGAGSLLARRIERAFAHLELGLGEVRRGGARAAASLLTLTQLRALEAICRHGAFASAARAEGLSLPALHRAARDLERVVDATLFERTSFGVRATRAGEALARRARLFFAELDQAESEIASLKRCVVGETVIGAMPLARGSFLPMALANLDPASIGHVRLVEGQYEVLRGGLLRGEIDFLVGALRDGVPARDLVQEHLFDDPLSILMRAGHPLARKRQPSQVDLAAYPWIAPRRSTPLDAHFQHLLARAPNVRTSAIECSSLSAARVLLLQSDRLMLLSDAQTVYERATGLLVSRPHPGGRITRPIGLSFRRDWQPTPTQALIVEAIRRAAVAPRRTA